MAISSQSRDIKFQAETFINLIHILSQARNFDKSSPLKSETELKMNKTTNGQTCFILQGSGFYKHSLDNPNLKCFLVVLFDNLLYHKAARRKIRYLRIQRKTLEDLYILGRKLRVVYQELFAKFPWCSFIHDCLTGIQYFLGTLRTSQAKSGVKSGLTNSSHLSPEHTKLYNKPNQ